MPSHRALDLNAPEIRLPARHFEEPGAYHDDRSPW